MPSVASLDPLHVALKKRAALAVAKVPLPTDEKRDGVELDFGLLLAAVSIMNTEQKAQFVNDIVTAVLNTVAIVVTE